MNFEKNIVSRYEKLTTEIEDEEVLIDFVESGETSFEGELSEKHKILKNDVEEFEINLLLDGEYDMNNAIVTIHSGAGGTEACDWADMLYRMYLRWCNLKGYKVSELDFMEGDSVGVKSVTFLVEGINAYGYLKSEKGVHRLVRISPFDANKKRHTSFASVEVVPEVDENVEFEINLLLDGEYDMNNAIVTIHSGAGGTEACDWADMLYRMYLRWCNLKNYKVTELDFMEGDSVGVKSVTFLVEGINAYGYLKSEKGVHRLVRISPFDANKKRHTSFASVEVVPEVDENVEVEIDPADIRIDTYRASGAGGQHVNMTDSAVRITHFPSGIVVTCQKERSQLSNRETAMKMLKSKLLELEIKKKEEEMKKIQGEQSDIGWGNQIRSYVFQPYALVKDHRTNTEIGNVKAVMDGSIDDFINSYLRWIKNN